MVNAKKKKKKTNREYHESLRDYTTEDAIVVKKNLCEPLSWKQ